MSYCREGPHFVRIDELTCVCDAHWPDCSSWRCSSLSAVDRYRTLPFCLTLARPFCSIILDVKVSWEPSAADSSWFYRLNTFLFYLIRTSYSAPQSCGEQNNYGSNLPQVQFLGSALGRSEKQVLMRQHERGKEVKRWK